MQTLSLDCDLEASVLCSMGHSIVLLTTKQVASPGQVIYMNRLSRMHVFLENLILEVT